VSSYRALTFTILIAYLAIILVRAIKVLDKKIINAKKFKVKYLADLTAKSSTAKAVPSYTLRKEVIKLIDAIRIIT
jgi:hypothetical protein